MADALQGEMEVGAPGSLGYSVISPPSDTAQPVLAHGKERLGVINQSITDQPIAKRGNPLVLYSSPPNAKRGIYGARTANRRARGRAGALKLRAQKMISTKPTRDAKDKRRRSGEIRRKRREITRKITRITKTRTAGCSKTNAVRPMDLRNTRRAKRGACPN